MEGGHKVARAITTREEYMRLRGSSTQTANLQLARSGSEAAKRRLVQMNYSCIPNEDGTLRGSTRMSDTVGMDVDFDKSAPDYAERMRTAPVTILAKAGELGLLMLERSVNKGYHLVFRRHPDMTNEENLRWASDILGIEYDKGAKDITRVFFTTGASEEDLLYLDDEIFENKQTQAPKTLSPALQTHPSPPYREGVEVTPNATGDGQSNQNDGHEASDEKCNQLPPCREGRGGSPSPSSLTAFDLCARQAGLNPDAMDVWGEHNWHTNLMAVLSVGVGKLMSRQQLEAVVAQRLPNYSQTDDCKKLIDYFYEKYAADKGFMNASLREINAQVQARIDDDSTTENVTDDMDASPFTLHPSLTKMPQGIRDSIDAVGEQLALPVITAICPCIGALATGVALDVHGQKKGLNLISYVAGDFASGKGGIDPVVGAWMSEVSDMDRMYHMQEDEWRQKKRAAKNKKEQPEEPKLPVRCITLNNTVANIAERLANAEGKHAFSFTPEADTVAQKWKSAMSDFSVMLRQSYDGSKYDREARSADAVNVHIERLLWNVTMCGTPDALYRVVNNYTDGFQSRIAVARTPDNTFAPLEDKPHVLTERQTEHIRQIAHLLQLMQGEVELPKLEEKGREWVERIRVETMMNDDKVRARQRFRICVTAQRMTCCIMLCKVCETLIHKHGLNGAETRMKHNPDLWKRMLMNAQTPQLLEMYDMIADSLLENALYFFRDRIENAFRSHDYVGSNDRRHIGKNDTIFARLDSQFTIEQARQQALAFKGTLVTNNSVKQMLKNWHKQGLIALMGGGQYRKIL